MEDVRRPGWITRRLWASAVAAAMGLSGCSLLDIAPPVPPVRVLGLPPRTEPIANVPMPTGQVPPPMEPAVNGGIQQVQATTPVPSAATVKSLPITLDAVFKLAEGHNPRIAQAREKLNESLMVQEMNCRNWLPNIYAGMAYYRHEGGIQQENGLQINSSTGAFVPGLNIQSELDLRESTFRQLNDQRLVWQDRAELTKIDNEVLLEAATTYVDFLTARRAQAIAELLEKSEQELFERAQNLAKSEVGATAFRESMQAALAARRHTIAKARQQGNAAMAKLVYLLGLPPGTVLEPQDYSVQPFELVDVSPTTEALVTQAMETGPGVRELAGLLGVIQTGLDKSYGAHNLLPTVGMNVFEGALGSGPGGSTRWMNRLDVGVNLRWNLTELTRTEDQRRRARSRLAQTMHALQDLRGKLALGVQEGKDAVLHGREQIGLASTQLQYSSESYRLSKGRLEKGAQGANPIEVVLALRALEQAHFNRLFSIASHNKAQVQLLMLLGQPTHATMTVNEQPGPMLPVPREQKP